MERLPDEVVLELMRYLDVPDLLTCRLVCKRLGWLALHPHVWRHRAVSSGDPWVCPVLRLAPCLHSIALRVDQCMSAERTALYTSTRCAVFGLSLHFHWAEEPPPPSNSEGDLRGPLTRTGYQDAALVIRNQEALGRLKCLALDWLDVPGAEGNMYEDEDDPLGDPTALLWTAALTAGLQTLDVPMVLDGLSLSEPVCQPRSAPSSSLCRFTCHLSAQSIPFCYFVLAAHAATLTEVALELYTELPHDAPTITLHLLANMPYLCRLYCPMLPGLEAAALCPWLTDVCLLIVEQGERPATPSAVKFLRHATQLKTVTLHYGDSASRRAGLDLVAALASSGGSQLVSLALRNVDPNGRGGEYDDLRPLIDALPKLPALMYLEFDGAPDELLVAITSLTAPALIYLVLVPCSEEKKCVHGQYMHRDLVQALLSSKPLLELAVRASMFCLQDACEFCALGCHPAMHKEMMSLLARTCATFSIDQEIHEMSEVLKLNNIIADKCLLCVPRLNTATAI